MTAMAKPLVADAQVPVSRRRRLAPLSGILAVTFFGTLAILNIAPLVWGILTSLKTESDLFQFPPVIFDFAPTLDNYRRVIESGFLGNMWATLLYGIGTVMIVLLLGLPAAYAFDRFDFPFRRTLLLLIVASIPLSLGAAALLIPDYIYFTRLGLTNSWYTLPIIYSAQQLPMTIWIIKGTLEGIPKELDEAAIADGANHFDILWRIMAPLSRPALGAAGILAFVGSWNEFVIGSVMIDDPSLRPIQPAIYNFIGYFGREWGPLTASATLAIIPILILFVLFGRLMVSGLTKGAVKG